jgi:hypothetical protein
LKEGKLMAFARAFRITLSHREGSFRLDSATHLEKVTPASAPVEGAQEQAGWWIALEDAKGRMLYRRFIKDPLEPQEAPGDEHEIRRVRIPGLPQGISLLVPDLPETEAIVLYGSETDPKGRTYAAKPVFKMSLREVAALAGKGGDHGRR